MRVIFILQSYTGTLRKTSLFEGIATHDLLTLLGCLEPKFSNYRKNDFIAISGERFESIGILLEGKAAVIKENAAGNRIVISIIKPGEIFGEVAVFAKNPVWPSSVVAQTANRVLFVSRQKILGQCQKVCPWHRTIIQNMLKIVSEKALLLNKKVEYLTIKSMRGKIAAFLLEQYKKTGSTTFDLPLNRNETAEYLNVSRPSMSREMCRMREEGVIDFHLSSVRIKNLDALKRMAE